MLFNPLHVSNVKYEELKVKKQENNFYHSPTENTAFSIVHFRPKD